MRASRSTPLTALMIGAALIVASCTSPNGSKTTTGTEPAAFASGPAAAQLNALTVVPDGSLSGYSRTEFGDGWATQPDHCDTRVDVLAAESVPGALVRHGCTITAGRWLSLYDGVTETSPHTLDIDHLVPLAEAWKTGAYSWTPARRVAFANDVSTELIAVTAHSNRSKGDQPPPGYEPPNAAEHCSYAVRWIAIKSKYQLTVTAPERAALAQMLTSCPDGR